MAALPLPLVFALGAITTVTATFIVLAARGLLSPRQAAASLGGIACGAAVGWMLLRVDHG